MTRKKNNGGDEPKAAKPAKAKAETTVPIAYPVRKTVSFISRAPSSGKRRNYEVEGVAHSPDQFHVVINGQTIYLQRAGVDAVVDLLTSLTGAITVKPEDAPDHGATDGSDEGEDSEETPPDGTDE